MQQKAAIFVEPYSSTGPLLIVLFLNDIVYGLNAETNITIYADNSKEQNEISSLKMQSFGGVKIQHPDPTD